MKRRFTEEQIIGILREQEAGGKVREIIRRHGISEQSFYLYGRLSHCKATSDLSSLVSCKHLSGVTLSVRGAQMGNPLAHASIAGRPHGPR